MCASIEELNREWSNDIAEKFIESDDPIKKLLGYNTLAITAVHCELEDHIKVCKKAEIAPTSLTPAERRAAATAISEWLDTYSQGVRPEGYEAAQAALVKIEAAYQRDRADAAEEDARVTRELRKASKRCEKNMAKIVKTLEQAKKKAATEEEAALYTALIAVIQDIAPNLVGE